MKIDFAGFSLSERKLIKKVFGAAVKKNAPKQKFTVCIVSVGADEIKALNKQYRQVDAVTDVLSFPSTDFSGGVADFSGAAVEKGYFNLGDIAVCRQVMEAQAAEYGHGQRRELAFLALHGMLHLLGFNHESEDDTKKMEQFAEETLLKCRITR